MKKTDNVIENLRLYVYVYIIHDHRRRKNTMIFRWFLGNFSSISNPATSNYPETLLTTFDIFYT